MTSESSGLVLPPVDGWMPPPSVTVPVYGLSVWHGPQWLLIYDGTDDRGGLRLVHLAYGDAVTRHIVAGVVTFAKQPDEDLGDGASVAATDLPYVADCAVMHLLERLPHPTRTIKARRKWEAEQFQQFSTGEIGPPGWSAVPVRLQEVVLTGFRANIEDGWAVCFDAGEVFVAMYSVTTPTSELAVRPVVDLSDYPLPSDANHPGA